MLLSYINQMGTFTYKAVKVLSKDLKQLCQNEYSISDTQKFLDMLSSLPPLLDHEKDVSDDVESLSTSIPIKVAIEYIIEQICSKQIFKCLLLKLATECKCTFSYTFYKQIDGCTIRGSLSVTFNDIYMIKIESQIDIPQKPLFFCLYIDEIYIRRKKFRHDEFLEKLIITRQR